MKVMKLKGIEKYCVACIGRDLETGEVHRIIVYDDGKWKRTQAIYRTLKKLGLKVRWFENGPIVGKLEVSEDEQGGRDGEGSRGEVLGEKEEVE